ncbi:MAG TPA: hypothetical protein VFW87_08665 [Pirellulales bacterium]|nr:hypothetical protein [Pirellulales bacterium]
MSSSELSDLRLLARLHYGLAVLTALFPLLTLPVLAAGIELFSMPDSPPQLSRPVALLGDDALGDDVEARAWRNALGKLAVGGAAAITAICLVHAALLWYVGSQISARRRWRLAMVFSALHLINVPLGTALSILSFNLLGRQGFREAFDRVEEQTVGAQRTER